MISTKIRTVVTGTVKVGNPSVVLAATGMNPESNPPSFLEHTAPNEVWVTVWSENGLIKNEQNKGIAVLFATKVNTTLSPILADYGWWIKDDIGEKGEKKTYKGRWVENETSFANGYLDGFRMNKKGHQGQENGRVEHR
jgi:hypothetical protein